MLYKYEYVDNAKHIAWHHEFDETFECKNGFSIELASKAKSRVVGGDVSYFEYNLKLRKGHIFCNVVESDGIKDLENLFPQYFAREYGWDIRYLIHDLFGIRAKYPAHDLLIEYYTNSELQDVEEFLRIFEKVFDAVVEKCGSQYRSSVMQGATELAFALSHKWHSKCCSGGESSS